MLVHGYVWCNMYFLAVPCSKHLLHFLCHLIDPGIPILLDEVEDPAHDCLPRQTTADDQTAECHKPGYRIHQLLQPEILDGDRPATDSGHYGAD